MFLIYCPIRHLDGHAITVPDGVEVSSVVSLLQQRAASAGKCHINIHWYDHPLSA